MAAQPLIRHLLEEDIEDIRVRLVDQNEPSRFPLLNDLREDRGDRLLRNRHSL